MKKTIVYIDGYNLYYGLVKGTKYKWLDMPVLVKSMINDDHEIVAVKYFTAPVKTYPFDAAATERQNVYLQAISVNPAVKTVLGFYAKHPSWQPARADTCKKCDTAKFGLVPIVKLEEKRSDVNIAEALRYECSKTVIVLNPQPSFSVHLKKAASFYKNIPRDLPARCQLPEEVKVGNVVLRRPTAWR